MASFHATKPDLRVSSENLKTFEATARLCDSSERCCATAFSWLDFASSAATRPSRSWTSSLLCFASALKCAASALLCSA